MNTTRTEYLQGLLDGLIKIPDVDLFQSISTTINGSFSHKIVYRYGTSIVNLFLLSRDKSPIILANFTID